MTERFRNSDKRTVRADDVAGIVKNDIGVGWPVGDELTVFARSVLELADPFELTISG